MSDKQQICATLDAWLDLRAKMKPAIENVRRRADAMCDRVLAQVAAHAEMADYFRSQSKSLPSAPQEPKDDAVEKLLAQYYARKA